MPPHKILPIKAVKGQLSLPGDKSIAHRSIILSSIGSGDVRIHNFPFNQDCIITKQAFSKMGVSIKKSGKNSILVKGKGLYGLRPIKKTFFSGDSGTTIRLLAGLLSGQRFNSILTASSSLSKRPMLRITGPLRLMGADIKGLRRDNLKEEFPPLEIKGKELHRIDYSLPTPSAQVKSCLLLAGLYSKNGVLIKESFKSRDHTERMLKAFGVRIKVGNNNITLYKTDSLSSPKNIFIPSDISSAAFFIACACIIPGSYIIIRDVSINPTRTGFLRVLKRMKADITVRKKKGSRKFNQYEPIGDIIVKASNTVGTFLEENEIPSLIDELPILMVVACLSKGETKLSGIQELRVKETDRIESMVSNLRRMGANVVISGRKASNQVIKIIGVPKLKGAILKSYDDHRTAMSLIVAALSGNGPSYIDDVRCIDKSFPDFFEFLRKVIKT